MGGEGNCGLESCDVDVDRLGAEKLSSVRSAIGTILFSALVFNVGESSARGRDYDSQLWASVVYPTSSTPANRSIGLDPTPDDEGGSCSETGCYIWADVSDPFGSAGGAFGGGGSGGTGSSNGGSGPPPPPPAIPISQLPNRDKLNCAANSYGRYKTKHPWVMDNIWAFAKDKLEAFSTSTPVPPPGYEPDDAVTSFSSEWPTGAQTILFAAGFSNPPANFYYFDPSTGVKITVSGPFSTFEWSLVTLAHELAHQNGVVSENAAEQYGKSVLDAYRDDGGKACP